jgi:hypothetical protein
VRYGTTTPRRCSSTCIVVTLSPCSSQLPICSRCHPGNGPGYLPWLESCDSESPGLACGSAAQARESGPVLAVILPVVPIVLPIVLPVVAIVLPIVLPVVAIVLPVVPLASASVCDNGRPSGDQPGTTEPPASEWHHAPPASCVALAASSA